MSNNANNCLPLASYTLAVFPGIPVAPIEADFPVSVRITMAAIDPARIEGDEEEPATLRILKPAEESYDDEDDEDEDEDDEDDEVSPEDMAKIKKLIAESEDGLEELEGDDDEDDEDDEEMELDEDDEDDEDDEGEIEDFVVCTLSPKFGYQQTLDLVITPGEQIMFEVTGSYAIHLSGNYIEHPYDMEDDDELLALGEDDEDEDEEDEDELDEGEYDLSPDEDEIINGDERLVELMEEDDDEEDDDDEEPAPEPKKILKRAAEEKKQEKAAKKAKVAFTKNLEQGPTPSEPKPKLVTRQLEGGVKIEDRTVGEGPSAKVGSKVGVRYVGKLANGKVFDSNSKGKPFYFSVGKGEVIRGWDIGVQGMKVKGERRIIIPAAMAYGKQKLPGIPPNSQLTFDVKVVNIK
ncbi:FK506-binding protein 3 [Yarrowia sp. B02]|nr:FK506-binding protein 3 [Yarrowia sp. B02]